MGSLRSERSKQCANRALRLVTKLSTDERLLVALFGSWAAACRSASSGAASFGQSSARVSTGNRIGLTGWSGE